MRQCIERAKFPGSLNRDWFKCFCIYTLEMPLQCPVLKSKHYYRFFQATSLNCAHVFCKLCINQWMKVKKECPNCRAPITSQMQALALDSYIDRMVEQLNNDLKQRRKELLEIRKGIQENSKDIYLCFSHWPNEDNWSGKLYVLFVWPRDTLKVVRRHCEHTKM